MGEFHLSQQECATHIVDFFESHQETVRYGVLNAEMQSGKTGTFHCVAQMMLKRGLIERVYILIGSAETLLKHQAQDDMNSYSDLYDEEEDYSDLCFIFPRGDLIANAEKIKENRSRSLFIVDESHLAQSLNETFDKFWKKVGIRPTGTTQELIDCDAYILSVSATGFSETSDIFYEDSHPKKVFTLIPGEDYRGVRWFCENNRIFPTFDIKDNTNLGKPTRSQEKFIEKVLDKGRKYNIVRVHGNHPIEYLLKLCEHHQIDTFWYESKNKTIYITKKEYQWNKKDQFTKAQHLEKIPKNPSLVFIKGSLRVGKVVPKKYIGFVWEDAESVKTDSLLQGLLGRMCGYHSYAVDIYVSPKVLAKKKIGGKQMNELERYISKDCLPTKAKNLDRMDCSTDKKNGFPTVPILISHKTLPDQFISQSVQKKKEKIIEFVKANDYALIRKSNNSEFYQIKMIESFRDHQKEISFRQWGGKNGGTYKGDFPKILDSIQKKKPYSGAINKDTIALLQINDSKNKILETYQEAIRGDFYLFIRVDSKKDIVLKSHIPVTTKKEIFSLTNDQEECSKEYYGEIACLTGDVLHDPGSFEKQLSAIILLSGTRCLSNYIQETNTFEFSKKSYDWKSIQQNKVEVIKEKLEKKLNVTISIEYIDKIQSDTFQISKIKW